MQIIWFQVFLSNTNNFQAYVFDPWIWPNLVLPLRIKMDLRIKEMKYFTLKSFTIMCSLVTPPYLRGLTPLQEIQSTYSKSRKQVGRFVVFMARDERAPCPNTLTISRKSNSKKDNNILEFFENLKLNVLVKMRRKQAFKGMNARLTRKYNVDVYVKSNDDDDDGGDVCVCVWRWVT